MFKPLTRLLLLVATSLHAQVTWVRHSVMDAPIPPNTVSITRKQGAKLYICRAVLPDRVHPGSSDGATCMVSFKGNTQLFKDFEFATAPHYSWARDGWGDGVIAGQLSGKADLYICRAHVVQGSVDGGFVPGKAYKQGPHADHCFVPFQGKELDFPNNFELLHIP